jgi:hypothetical protein
MFSKHCFYGRERRMRIFPPEQQFTASYLMPA